MKYKVGFKGYRDITLTKNRLNRASPQTLVARTDPKEPIFRSKRGFNEVTAFFLNFPPLMSTWMGLTLVLIYRKTENG